MPKLHPYLNFNGNALEAFNFYQSVFGVKIDSIHRFRDFPMEGTESLSEEDLDKIMHIGLPIGNGIILMGSDIVESMGQIHKLGNNTYIYIETSSQEEADHLYSGLSEGGTIEMPIGEVPWGAYFGMFRDKFNIQWMVSFDINPQET